MSEVIDIIIVCDKGQANSPLEKDLVEAFSDYTCSFRYVKYEDKIKAVVPPALLLFCMSVPDQSRGDSIARLIEAFPGAAKAVLVEKGKLTPKFLGYLKNLKIDEVMTLVQLETGLGRRLIRRLVEAHIFVRTEAEIQKSEERFRGIIEHASDIITLMESDGTIIYQSPSFQRLLGYSPWEILGKNAFDFMHQEDVARVLEVFNKVVTGEMQISPPTEFRFQHADGSWRHLSSIGTNQLDNEAVQAVVVNSRDITEEKQAQLELEKYRVHLEDLVEQRTREVEAVTRKAAAVLAASPDALMAIDNDGRISFVSEHWRKTYPTNADNLIGMPIEKAFEVLAEESNVPPGDPRYEEMKAWWKNPQGQKEFRTNNGIWLRNQAAPMLDGSGTAVSTTNITVYKEQERLLAKQSEELAQALDKERRVTEQQRRFVTMVSHEFRTPLTIIDGNAQIIQRRGTSLSREDMQKRTKTIRDAVNRLVQMIETVLSSDMMEKGKLSLSPEQCDLGQIITQVCQEQQDVDKNHKIKVSLENVPKSIVVDPKLMFQVFTNIVSNAVKYSPENTDIDVKAWGNGEWVYVSVRDKGVGIPKEEQASIFRRFFRASTSTGIPGSGIGLNITRELVELHKGEISVDSEVGQGTVITVKLPLAAPVVPVLPS